MANFNCLEPEKSLFNSSPSEQKYHSMVVDAFREVYAKDVVARVIVLPSFEPEYAIALKKHEEVYTAFMVSPIMQLWIYKIKEEDIENGKINQNDQQVERMKEVYPTYNDIPLTRCSVEIETDLGDKLLTVWEIMLLTTRYYKYLPNLLKIDGVSYHYSTCFFCWSNMES